MTISAVNAYSSLIHEFAAEVGCVAHNGIAQNAQDASDFTGFLFSQEQRRCKQSGATQVEETVNQSKATSRRINIGPIRYPRYCRASRPEQSDSD